MNAKELIAAAEIVREFCESGLAEYGYMPTEDEAANALSSHILATVRPDDDEPLTEEWETSIGNPLTGVLRPKVKTRGECRQLCRLLGVEVKEGK